MKEIYYYDIILVVTYGGIIIWKLILRISSRI